MSILSSISCVGIIPAYAGNTRRQTRTGGQVEDHPRVCGEHDDCTNISVTMSGSSPRMRGTRHAARGSGEAPGIIPAYAGNTRTSRHQTKTHGDHPRVCGEHHAQYRHDGNQLGIIPAYAGNTCPTLARPARSRDHPRVCGEHTRMAVLYESRTGSSPRMRGTLFLCVLFLQRVGIIPAYAGNTYCRCLNS